MSLSQLLEFRKCVRRSAASNGNRPVNVFDDRFETSGIYVGALVQLSTLLTVSKRSISDAL